MANSQKHEIRVGQRLGFTGKLLTVRVDDVQLPSGRRSVREVVEHPGAVAIVATTDDDHVLLVRQFRYPVGRELLEIPAGTREFNEAPDVTAARELIEETGYEAGPLTLITTFFSSPGFCTEEIVLFHADSCRPAAHDRDVDEAAHLDRVPFADLPSLLTSGEHHIADGHTFVGLLWLLRHRDGAI